MTFLHDEPLRALRALDRAAAQMLSGSRAPMSVPLDVWREGRTYRVEIDLPGVDPADIDLQVERTTVTVSARRRAGFEGASEGEDREVVVAERAHGSFRRQLVLGEGLDADGVRAEYTDGVLRLTIPLEQESRPRRITVQGVPGSDSSSDSGSGSSDGDSEAPAAAI